MTVKLSTGLVEGLAVTGSLRSLINGCLVRIYSGTEPATADAAIGGATLMLEVSVDDDGTPLTWEASAPGGVLSKSASEVWEGENLQAGGVTFFRIVKPGDTGAASTTDIRMQGSAGGLGNDLVITDLPLVAGQSKRFELFQVAVPKQG